MNVESDQSPFMGFSWNEAEGADFVNGGLLTIIALDLNGKPHVIGTGFVIKAGGGRALAITAAHVFSEVRRLQCRPSRHSPSALAEFLPPLKPIDIDRKALRVISVSGGTVEPAIIDWLAFDEASDIAYFSIALQDGSARPFFSLEFALDASIPAIGDLVGVISYGDQGVLESAQDGT